MAKAIANYIGKRLGESAEEVATVFTSRVEDDGGIVEAEDCLITRVRTLKNLGLWDKASAVWLPHGYKESKLYAVKGGANADLTVARAGTRTRKGPTYVEQVPYNLLRYSQTLGNAAWIKAADVTVTDNIISAPDGSMTADEIVKTGVGTFRNISQGSVTVSVNGVYTYSFYVKANTSLSGRLLVLGTSTNVPDDIDWVNDGVDVGDGWRRHSITFTALDTSLTFYLYPTGTGASAGSVYAWGAMLNVGTSAGVYFATTDRFNVPALDYTNDTCPALSLEPARTNLFTQSEDFSHADWIKGSTPTVVANSIVAPDGLSTADKITANAVATVAIQIETITANTNYATSFYVKPDTHNYVYIRFTSGTAENFVSKVFDLSDGTVGETKVGTTSGTLVSATIEPELNEDGVATGWYRIILVASVNITTGNIGWGFAGAKTGNVFNTSGTITSGTFNGNQSMYVWGAQLEAGSYVTSYIPTTTGTVGRIADAISAPVERTLVDNNEGTFYFEGSSFADSTSKGILTISDGTTINRIMLSLSSTNLIALTITSGSVAVAAINTPFTSGTYYKVCMVYRNNYAALFVNGVKIGEDVSVSLPSTVNNFYVTKDQSGSSNFVGYMNGLLASKTAFTDAEAIALSTL